MTNLPRSLARNNPRYTHVVNSGVLFDLGRVLMDCDVHVVSVSSPAKTEAHAVVNLNALPIRDLWQRLQVANVMEEGEDWPTYKLVDEFELWFRPDAHDFDKLTIVFKIKTGCDL